MEDEMNKQNRPIGVAEFAQIVGRAPITIRRRINPSSKYYDPRIPMPRRDGMVYFWYEYEAYQYLQMILGPPLVPFD
jgi:hypothetical protein